MRNGILFILTIIFRSIIIYDCKREERHSRWGRAFEMLRFGFRLGMGRTFIRGSVMSVTFTSTLGVNAAFLQEIKEENHELRELLQSTANCFEALGPATPCVRLLADLLGQLRDQFSLHFALEEAFGYFDDAVSVAPRLSITAERLREEHNTLFVEACSLAEVAECFVYREPSDKSLERIGHRWATFYRRFLDHESEETELVLAAFDDDIGVGD